MIENQTSSREVFRLPTSKAMGFSTFPPVILELDFKIDICPQVAKILSASHARNSRICVHSVKNCVDTSCQPIF